jgi:hypothetical protein
MKLPGKTLLNKQGRLRAIAGLLLLAYGSAGVLGYGLHALWDCGHDCQHSHSGSVVHAHHHGHAGGCHHHHGHDHQDHGPAVANAELDQGLVTAAADDCPICEFLVQAQAPFVMELATARVEPVTIARCWREISYDAPLWGIHAARGPPVG